MKVLVAGQYRWHDLASPSLYVLYLWALFTDTVSKSDPSLWFDLDG